MHFVHKKYFKKCRILTWKQCKYIVFSEQNQAILKSTGTLAIFVYCTVSSTKNWFTVQYTYIAVYTDVTVPKVNDFPPYNMKCSGGNLILRGIFHVVKHFPLHFMLYRRNLDYFSNRVGSASSAQHFPGFRYRIIFSLLRWLLPVLIVGLSGEEVGICRVKTRYFSKIKLVFNRSLTNSKNFPQSWKILSFFKPRAWPTLRLRITQTGSFLVSVKTASPWEKDTGSGLGASSFPWASLEVGYRLGTGKDTGSGLGRIQARDWNGKGKKLRRLLIRELH